MLTQDYIHLVLFVIIVLLAIILISKIFGSNAAKTFVGGSAAMIGGVIGGAIESVNGGMDPLSSMSDNKKRIVGDVYKIAAGYCNSIGDSKTMEEHLQDVTGSKPGDFNKGAKQTAELHVDALTADKNAKKYPKLYFLIATASYIFDPVDKNDLMCAADIKYMNALPAKYKPFLITSTINETRAKDEVLSMIKSQILSDDTARKILDNMPPINRYKKYSSSAGSIGAYSNSNANDDVIIKKKDKDIAALSSELDSDAIMPRIMNAVKFAGLCNNSGTSSSSNSSYLKCQYVLPTDYADVERLLSMIDLVRLRAINPSAVTNFMRKIKQDIDWIDNTEHEKRMQELKDRQWRIDEALIRDKFSARNLREKLELERENRELADRLNSERQKLANTAARPPPLNPFAAAAAPFNPFAAANAPPMTDSSSKAGPLPFAPFAPPPFAPNAPPPPFAPNAPPLSTSNSSRANIWDKPKFNGNRFGVSKSAAF